MKRQSVVQLVMAAGVAAEPVVFGDLRLRQHLARLEMRQQVSSAQLALHPAIAATCAC